MRGRPQNDNSGLCETASMVGDPQLRGAIVEDTTMPEWREGLASLILHSNCTEGRVSPAFGDIQKLNLMLCCAPSRMLAWRCIWAPSELFVGSTRA